MVGIQSIPKKLAWPPATICPKCDAQYGKPKYDDVIYDFLCRFYQGGHHAGVHSKLDDPVEHWHLDGSSSTTNPAPAAWIEFRGAAALAALGAAAAGIAAIVALRSSPACSLSTNDARRRHARETETLLRSCSIDARDMHMEPVDTNGRANTTREFSRTLLLSSREDSTVLRMSHR